MSFKKTILINPNFLKIGMSKTSKSNKRKSRKENLRSSIKPNDIKKKLMSKIKNHQHQTIQKDEGENKEKFTKDFNNQLDYLEKIISSKKKKKHRKRTKKVKPTNNDSIVTPIPIETNKREILQINTTPAENHTVMSSSPSLLNPNSPTLSSPCVPLSPPIHLSTPTSLSSPIPLSPPTPLPPPTPLSPRISIPTNPQISSVQHTTFERPKYGCLKGGTLPTYSQYRKTLKKKSVVKEKIQFTPLSPISNDTLQRKQKLELLKQKLVVSEPIPIKKFIKKKKTIKIYKLGKNKQKNSIGVLIKSGKTRKLVKDEQNVLRTRCMSEVKQYLRKHNLIKAGTAAPDDILRKLYEDSFLAGNIYNKNPENLIHNFFKDV